MLRERLLELDEEMGVKPSEYALELIPFRDLLLEHGTAEGCKWLTYVFHMRDPRSLYNAYTERNKHIEVTTNIFGKPKKPDSIVEAALEFYNEHETSTMRLLRSARESINGLQVWLASVDSTDEDYDALKHVNILEKMGKTVQSLKILEEAAEKEADSSTTRGSVELNEHSI